MTLRPLDAREIPSRGADLIDLLTTALLLWDLQNGLGGQAPELAELSTRWKALIDSARKAGLLIVWSQHVAPPSHLMDDPEVWRLMRKQKVARPSELRPYMQPGSHDGSFISGFAPGEQDLVITKSTPSLFFGTSAGARLRTAGIRSLVMAGVATDIGIEHTAREALVRGFFPVIAEDAVGAYSNESQARGLACLRSFAFVEQSDAILSRLP